MRRALLASALVLAATGCSIGPTSAPHASPTQSAAATITLPSSSVSLLCRDIITGRDVPDPDLTVVFDQVALPTRSALQVNADPSEPDPGARWWAKVGLFVARGSSFELIVPAEWIGHLSMNWGSPGERTTHLYVSGCDPTRAETAWVVFAGGFQVDKPACVPLLVRAGDFEQLVHIGVGAACPGQSAPRK
jgi:hypothetical protein